MSDDALNSARLHLSEAAELAKTMADGFAMKKLTRALNRCNPINVNPHSPQGYAENAFEGGNVGAPPQNPQYSVGSYDAASPLPVTEYPGDTVPPALPDPCQGMKATLQACAPPSTYCPSFMGQPTGEVRPLAGTPQPLDTYASFTDQPMPIDPTRSLNDTLRQLWLRNAVQQSSQMPYAQGHKPKGPGGGQFTSGSGSGGGGGITKKTSQPKPSEAPALEPRIQVGSVFHASHAKPGEDVVFGIGDTSTLDGKPLYNQSGKFQATVVAPPYNDWGVWTVPTDKGLLRGTKRAWRPAQQTPTQNSAAYSYPQNPDGRAQGPMTAIPQGDFLGGRFGPGIKRMREQLNNCRR